MLRARRMYATLMARPDLPEEDAKSVVIGHLTFSIYKRNDLYVAQLLDTAGKRGYFDGDDSIVVDLMRRLLHHGRKSYDEFAVRLLSRLQHPAGEAMPYEHKVNLLRVYSTLSMARAALGATTAHTMRDAAQATFSQIELDGQHPGLWARVFLLEVLVTPIPHCSLFAVIISLLSCSSITSTCMHQHVNYNAGFLPF